jgi:hypothetical protein
MAEANKNASVCDEIISWPHLYRLTNGLRPDEKGNG